MSPDRTELSPREQRAIRMRDNELLREYYSARSVIDRWNWLETRVALPATVLAVLSTQVPLLSSIIEPALIVGVSTFVISELFKREPILNRDAYDKVIRWRGLRVYR